MYNYIIMYTVSWIFTVNVLLYILGYSRVSLYTTVQQDYARLSDGTVNVIADGWKVVCNQRWGNFITNIHTQAQIIQILHETSE